MKIYNGPAIIVDDKSWFGVQDKSDDVGEIYIYGTITDEKWLEEDVTPSWFRDEIKKLKDKKKIVSHINSPGGGVFAGITIYNMLKRHKAEKTTIIEGIAASIASIIALGADKIVMPKNSMVMIHKAWAIVVGNAIDMRKEADVMEKVDSSIASAIVAKTGRKEAEILDLMAAETWWTADEAKKMGYADEVSEEMKLAACIRGNTAIINGQEIDIGKFHSFPTERFNKQPAIAADPDGFKRFEARHKHNLSTIRSSL
jgi:ATP-dependent Clp endopeptidase proteolytic subunit ClpP